MRTKEHSLLHMALITEKQGQQRKDRQTKYGPYAECMQSTVPAICRSVQVLWMCTTNINDSWTFVPEDHNNFAALTVAHA